MREVDPATFLFVTGFGHRAEHYDYVRQELAELGHHSLVTEAPEDPTATFDEHANAIINDAKGLENIVLAPHSRGFNPAMRAAHHVTTKLVVAICPSIDTSTTAPLGRPRPHEVDSVPAKYFPDNEGHFIWLPDGSALTKAEYAEKHYYNRCSPELRRWAVSLLRPQSRPMYEPPMLEWPNVQLKILYGKFDQQIRREYQRYTARKWLGTTPIQQRTDHSPFISVPRKTAKKLVSFYVESEAA